MIDEITKIMEPVLYTALTALAGVVMVAIAKVKGDTIAWLQSKTNKDQQALITAIAKEAYAYAEKAGVDKLEKSFWYVQKELSRRGIEIDGVKVHAAIQAAWEQYGNNKGGVTIATQSEIEKAVSKVVE